MPTSYVMNMYLILNFHRKPWMAWALESSTALALARKHRTCRRLRLRAHSASLGRSNWPHEHAPVLQERSKWLHAPVPPEPSKWLPGLALGRGSARCHQRSRNGCLGFPWCHQVKAFGMAARTRPGVARALEIATPAFTWCRQSARVRSDLPW